MTNSPLDDAMKARLEFIKEISLVQAKLFRPGIESTFFDPEEKKKFKLLRLDWSIYVARVEIDTLSVLIDRLEANEAGFEEGIKEINQTIQDINNTVDFLNLLKRVLGIIGRIVTLAI